MYGFWEFAEGEGCRDGGARPGFIPCIPQGPQILVALGGGGDQRDRPLDIGCCPIALFSFTASLLGRGRAQTS